MVSLVVIAVAYDNSSVKDWSNSESVSVAYGLEDANQL